MRKDDTVKALFVILMFVIVLGCPKPGPAPHPSDKLNGTGQNGKTDGGETGVVRPGDDEIRNAMEEHRSATGNGKIEARLKLSVLIEQYPDSELADNALLDLARSYLVEESYDEGLPLLKRILDEYPKSDSAPEARFLLGMSLYRMGRCDEALPYLDDITPNNVNYPNASLYHIDCMVAAGRYDDAAKRYAELLKVAPERAAEAEESFRKIEKNASGEDLARIAEMLPPSPLSAGILYRLGERAYNRGDLAAARVYLERITTAMPDSPRAADAEVILGYIDEVGKVDDRAIGLLLPLSGKIAPYGQRFMEGAAVAVGAFQPMPDDDKPIRLEIMDTESDPEATRRAVEKLAVDKRVIAIAGPIQRSTAIPAAKTAQAYGVPIVTMTQLEEITEIGPMVFRNSVTPRDQTRTLIWYSVTAMGMRNFAVLYPDHSLGRLFNEVFIEEARRQGATVVLSIPYDPAQADFRNEIKQITKIKRDIDAIFIPDSYMKAVTIAPQFTYYNVIRVRLLGSNGWNNPRLVDLARGQMSSIENAVFTDIIFDEALNPVAQKFIHDFEDAYGRKPGAFEAMGYETVRLIMEQIRKKGVTSRRSMREALAGVKDFHSFSGPMEARSDRSFHRQLLLLQVRNGRIVDISTGDF